jgi:FixJ family two-component response regulator
VSDETLISIVDDDKSVREATRGLMSALGFTAEAFASGEDFLKSGGVQGTSCLIVDMQMPGMSGLELHAQLVASGRAIPTILITAYPGKRGRARALDAGITCYLTKPFSEDALLDCIRFALDPDSEHGPRSDGTGTSKQRNRIGSGFCRTDGLLRLT